MMNKSERRRRRVRGEIEERYDAIVVGAGIGGLTSAALLARAGKRVLALDQHYVAGGNATLFRRGKWAFDVGLHYIGDAHPGGKFDAVLRACGVSGIEMRPMSPELERMRFPDFEFCVPHSREAYRERLLQRFPRERRGIERYCRLLAQSARAARADIAGGLAQRVASIARGPLLVRNVGASIGAFIDGCTSDMQLRAVLTGQHGTYAVSPRKVAAVLHTGLQNHYFTSGGWYPAGGGQEMSDRLACAVEDAGGEIRLRATVEKIHVTGGRATGVTFNHIHLGRRTVSAPVVVCNADLRRMSSELLDERELPSAMARATRRLARYEMAFPLFMVCLGLSIPKEQLPYSNSNLWLHPRYDFEAEYAMIERGQMPAPPPIYISTASLKDPHNAMIAPPGHSNLEIMAIVPNAPAFWGLDPATDGADPGHRDYSKNPRYLEVKERLLEQCIDQAEVLIPGLKANIVHKEAATPFTHSRYTRSTHGSAYGFASTPAQFLHNRPTAKTAVRGLYLCGTNCRDGHGVIGATISAVRAADAVVGKGLRRRILGATRP